MHLLDDSKLDPRDIAIYRRVLEDMGGIASLAEIARHADRVNQAHSHPEAYIGSCLTADGYAWPAAHERDTHGNPKWIEALCTLEDLDAGRRMLLDSLQRAQVEVKARLRALSAGGTEPSAAGMRIMHLMDRLTDYVCREDTRAVDIERIAEHLHRIKQAMDSASQA